MKTIRLKIKVTKEVIKRAMWCGKVKTLTSESCAIALAIRDLFPDFVVLESIRTKKEFRSPGIYARVCSLPLNAMLFIHQFDALKDTPEKRLELDPIEFEVDIPEKYFPEISEVHKILTNCQTMELV